MKNHNLGKTLILIIIILIAIILWIIQIITIQLWTYDLNGCWNAHLHARDNYRSWVSSFARGEDNVRTGDFDLYSIFILRRYHRCLHFETNFVHVIWTRWSLRRVEWSERERITSPIGLWSADIPLAAVQEATRLRSWLWSADIPLSAVQEPTSLRSGLRWAVSGW